MKTTYNFLKKNSIILYQRLKYYKKHNSKTKILLKVDAKILSIKILANLIQLYIERITHHNQVEFIPEM